MYLRLVINSQASWICFLGARNMFINPYSQISITFLVANFALRRIFEIMPNRSRNKKKNRFLRVQQVTGAFDYVVVLIVLFYTRSLYVVLDVIEFTIIAQDGLKLILPASAFQEQGLNTCDTTLGLNQGIFDKFFERM